MDIQVGDLWRNARADYLYYYLITDITPDTVSFIRIDIGANGNVPKSDFLRLCMKVS
jgi:hypothetical protein